MFFMYSQSLSLYMWTYILQLWETMLTGKIVHHPGSAYVYLHICVSTCVCVYICVWSMNISVCVYVLERASPTFIFGKL